MSGFTPSVSFTTEFDGDTVSMRLRRLKRKDLNKVSPYMKMADPKSGLVQLSLEESFEFLEIMSGVLPEYVQQFKGLTDAEGNPLDLNQALEESYFIPLISAITGRLFEISNVQEGEAKNSAGQPSDTTPDSTT